MKTGKILLALIGALVVGTGSAQTWTVNGATQSTGLTTSSTESAVAINPVDGVVAIKTAGVVTTPVVTVGAPATASIGQTISVSWSTSGFSSTPTCTASSTPSVSGWSGVVTTTPVQVTMPGTGGNVALSLSCNGTASNIANVNVSNSPPCPAPGYQPTSGAFVPYQVGIESFSARFEAPFPAISSQVSGTFSTGIGTAFEFIAPSSVSSDGFFNMALTTGGGGGGITLTSISKCPGEWADSLNATGRLCYKVFGETQVEWTINNNLPFSQSRCLLIPGERYYLNNAFQTCEFGSCSFRIFSRSASQRPAE